MNPYKESTVGVPTKNEPIDEQRAIYWFIIIQAGLIGFLFCTVANVVFEYLGKVYVTNENDFDLYVLAYSAALVSCWSSGAAYLAFRVKHLWGWHGLIYSLIPTALSLFNDVRISINVTGAVYPSVLGTFLLYLVVFIVATLTTMVTIRLLFRLNRAH